ncbi:MAG: polyphosphate kinase 2 family protein [Bacteriovoracia bacterium]
MSSHKETLKKLQLKMLRAQQGIYHRKERLIIAIEGVDASGKGGVIRRITEKLDPRSYFVHPIGIPSPEDQGKHYLYRFWTKIPAPGSISIFDRTWYGRVLVERVENLIPEKKWKSAYNEINQFEKLLADDGVILIKIFLQISKTEQLKRFEARLKDPYKQWKISEADIRNRAKWDDYSLAFDDMIKETDSKDCPWHVVKTDDKEEAREEVLKIITNRCKDIEKWMEDQVHLFDTEELKKALDSLG